MPKLSENFIEELRFRNPITEVVSSYVQLKRAGRLMKGLCPFHSEKTPSFVVYEESNSYYCFGCGAGGDVITFVRAIDNLDYMDAVRMLAQRCGMQVPEDGADKETARLRERILAINRETARFYYSCLGSPEGSAARRYVAGRKLSAETVRHFGIGYAPDDFNSLVSHLSSKGFTEKEMLEAGMKPTKRGSPYDQFRGRLIFPIIDVRGNVIAFGGRKLSEDKPGPKYLNSSDTPVFKKSHGVFALNFAKDVKNGTLILCEGYMDVIAMHQAGFCNAVATLGTAFTDEQARLLSRYAEEIILAFDADGPGQKAISRGIEILKKLDVRIRVLSIPGSKDPDEYIRENGADRFKALLDGASTQTDFRLNAIKNRHDLQTSEGKVEYIRECTLLLAEMSNAAEREVYASKAAEEAGVSRAALLTEAENARKKLGSARKKKEAARSASVLSGFGDTVNPEKKLNLRAANAEEALIAALVATPELAEEAAEYMPPEEFVTSFDRRLYEAVIDGIKTYGHFDIGMLGGDFSPAEIGKIQGFTLQNGRRAAGIDEIREYADIIREQKRRAGMPSVSEMDDEDFGKLIEEIARKKK